MLFLNKNKKKKKKLSLLVFLFSLFIIGGSGLFFTNARFAYARACNNSYYDILGGCYYDNYDINNPISSLATPAVDTTVAIAEGWVKDVLLGVFHLFGLLVSVAITIFDWVAKPGHISGPTGVLNRPAIYEMWQFIRDFFNLFFILVLLYIAFTTVFQIQKNFKQMILSLIIAALLVNFSFPISRFIIDATNVPMYFFANQMMTVTQKGTVGNALGETLSASKIEGILLPSGANTDITTLLFAIIFIFMFAITLTVIAIMLVVRLVALMILVIFASVGFAAAIIPGMEKYSKMWWDNLWKYALYGPASMLMLLIAVKFFVEIGKDNAAIYDGLHGAAGNLSSEPTYLASLAMFSVPIIVLWFAISLGQTMALAGGATISGYGHKFAAWAGKKASGYSAFKRNWDSYSAARKKRTDEKNKNNFGSQLGKTWNKAEDRFYGATRILPGSKAAQQRVKDMHNKEVYEKAEENDKIGIGDTQLINDLEGRDKIKSAAAAISLTKRKAIKTNDQFVRALEVLGDNSKEIGGLIDNASDDAMAISGEKYGEMIKEGSIIGGNDRLKSQLDSRLRKTGNVKTLVDYQTEVKKVDTEEAVKSEMKNVKSAKDVAASESIFKDEKYRDYAVGVVAARGLDHIQEVKKSSAQEGTSVGGYFAVAKSREEVRKEREEKKKDEDKKASALMGSLRGSDYKYPGGA